MFGEHTLLSLDGYVMLQQSTKHLVYQRHMRGTGGGIDQNIIDINNHALPVQVPENLVYKLLKDGWSIL